MGTPSFGVYSCIYCIFCIFCVIRVFFFCSCQILPLAVWETRKQPAVTVYPRRFEQNRRRYPGLPPAVFKPPALTWVTPDGLQTAGGKVLPPARWSPAVCKPPGITEFWPPAVRVSLVVTPVKFVAAVNIQAYHERITSKM